jgi:anaerobic selenocysteine-containing dehydrogenase
MVADKPSGQRIPGYCAMCVSRCGSIAVVENGHFVALEPDPSHPTGKALCAKGAGGARTRLSLGAVALPAETNPAKGRSRPGVAAYELGRST